MSGKCPAFSVLEASIKGRDAPALLAHHPVSLEFGEITPRLALRNGIGKALDVTGQGYRLARPNLVEECALARVQTDAGHLRAEGGVHRKRDAPIGLHP